jgi:hypothetical protein
MLGGNGGFPPTSPLPSVENIVLDSKLSVVTDYRILSDETDRVLNCINSV